MDGNQGNIPFPGVIFKVMAEIIPGIFKSYCRHIMLKCKRICIGELCSEREVGYREIC